MLFLAGCAAGADDYLEYTGGPFSASIEGRAGDIDFAAELSFGPPAPGQGAGRGGAASGERDIFLRFIRPSGMAGVSIERRGGMLKVSSGGVSLDGSRAAGWLEPAELLIPEGRVLGAKIVDDGGAKIAAVEVSTADGIIFIYVDTDSGYPVRVVGEAGGREVDFRVAAFGFAD